MSREIKQFVYKGIPYMQTLDLNEIGDGTHFEELVRAYFQHLHEDKSNNVARVETSPPSVGADGGRDIVITFDMDDSLSKFQRTWVVQCKFHRTAIGQSQLGHVNLPSLVKQYGADGYLLVCKTNPTKQLESQFNDLNKNPKDPRFLIWTGEDLKARLIEMTSLHSQFFPRFHAYNQLVDQIKKETQ